MSVLTSNFFDAISKNIFALHNINQYGAVVEPQHTQCQNRAALIFALESVLDAHREKFATIWSPLTGRKALEHLLIQKYRMPLAQIKAISLEEIILLLQEELVPAKLPEMAIKILNLYSSMHSKLVFPDFLEEEWNPDLYLTIPKQQNW